MAEGPSAEAEALDEAAPSATAAADASHAEDAPGSDENDSQADAQAPLAADEGPGGDEPVTAAAAQASAAEDDAPADAPREWTLRIEAGGLLLPASAPGARCTPFLRGALRVLDLLLAPSAQRPPLLTRCWRLPTPA
jgi:hypothetical protein